MARGNVFSKIDGIIKWLKINTEITRLLRWHDGEVTQKALCVQDAGLINRSCYRAELGRASFCSMSSLVLPRIRAPKDSV